MNQVTSNEETITGNVPSVFAAYKADSKISFIRPYDPKVQAIAGFRHAVIRYRVTDGMKAKGTVEKPALMVTIPQITLPDSDYMLPEKASSVLLGVLEDAQDTIIKGLIEDKASTIGWSHVTLDATLEAMTAVRVSQRLTREQIENWSKVAMKEVCEARAAIQGRNVAEYYETFGALAAAVPNIGEATAKVLNALLTESKCADDMSKVLAKKLHAVLNPSIGKGL
jgi:hypothetical protein